MNLSFEFIHGIPFPIIKLEDDMKVGKDEEVLPVQEDETIARELLNYERR